MTLSQPEGVKSWMRCLGRCLAISECSDASCRVKHTSTCVQFLERAKPSDFASLVNINGPIQQEKGTWTVMFKGSAGIGKPMYDFLTSVTKAAPMEQALSSCACNACHYKNRLFDNWKKLGIKRVKLALFKGSEQVAFVTFNGVDSTETNWFAKSRLLSSSWTDLTKTSTANFFSLAGHIDSPGNVYRRFFINRSYGGCKVDKGWMVVYDKSKEPCLAVNNVTGLPCPIVLYSKKNTATTYSAKDFGIADSVEILTSTEE
ncbi:uncharacterized protein LOC135501867 [Lineus longissimus]|uniref:uncharacterized protein LOC135501867 n=1 Tax=Lineus longissimus TaxID=88925 RepID=UPI00315CD259